MSTILIFVILIFSAIIHEVSHGVVAGWLGDDTAKRAGRITLNPLVHIDPIMTIAFPVFLYLTQLGIAPEHRIIFGAAKGVPFNPANLKDPKVDSGLVALAGPASNFILALIFTFLIKIPAIAANPMVVGVLSLAILINLMLAVFNMVPIPPMDGSKVLAAFFPDGLREMYLSIERFGYLLIFIFLYSGTLNLILYPIIDFYMKTFKVFLF